MKKIIITSGPPASGKTTFVQSQINNPNTSLHVNRDLIRDALTHGLYSSPLQHSTYKFGHEKLIDNCVVSIMHDFFNKPKLETLYISDTNLGERLLATMYTIYALKDKYGLKDLDIEIHTFYDIPLEELLKRNANRERQVPNAIIRSMTNNIPRSIEICEQLVSENRIILYNH